MSVIDKTLSLVVSNKTRTDIIKNSVRISYSQFSFSFSFTKIKSASRRDPISWLVKLSRQWRIDDDSRMPLKRIHWRIFIHICLGIKRCQRARVAMSIRGGACTHVSHGEAFAASLIERVYICVKEGAEWRKSTFHVSALVARSARVSCHVTLTANRVFPANASELSHARSVTSIVIGWFSPRSAENGKQMISMFGQCTLITRHVPKRESRISADNQASFRVNHRKR